MLRAFITLPAVALVVSLAEPAAVWAEPGVTLGVGKIVMNEPLRAGGHHPLPAALVNFFTRLRTPTTTTGNGVRSTTVTVIAVAP